MAVANLETFLDLLPDLQQARNHSLDMYYDQEVDVLYINFHKDERADDSELSDDNVIIRYAENGDVIGYTILNASTRQRSD